MMPSSIRLPMTSLMAAAVGVALASCSGPESGAPDLPTPSAVPKGAVAVVGDSTITTGDYRTSLRAGLSGYDPLSPTRTVPEPLDPPGFSRCISAITARAKNDPDLAGLGRAEFLSSCRQRLEQLRSLTLSGLIEDRWTLLEAEQEGVEVTEAEADALIDQLELAWARSPARSRVLFRKAVEESGLTPAQLRADALAAVARQRLATLGTDGEQDPEALARAERERFDAWRAKTLCAKGLLVPQCSNGPDPGA